MNDFETYSFLKKQGLQVEPPEEKIRGMVNDLIKACYIPVGDRPKFVVDPERLRLFKIVQEPINWGDLHCAEVNEYKDGSFQVIIEEASPAKCHTFCAYIEKYMKAWGWDIKVVTEW